MWKDTCALVLSALALMMLTACATDNSDPGAAGSTGDVTLVDDGTGQQVRYDTDGAMVVGVRDEDLTTRGPAELRDNKIIYFNYDSDQIQQKYVEMMQQHARYLRGNPDARVIIEGHTDERGTPEYNIALGERRARSVAHYMQNLGVDVGQMSIVSFGEEKPVEHGHNEAAWSRNRRAVLNY